ncbi:VOC family protein [Micromonospora sp. CPCC 205539]|uniref:VOC family protein n=1 Tax=Micromonospora sp. CPCC 205539 TaxID=3122408 RepID=UPI002FF36B7C
MSSNPDPGFTVSLHNITITVSDLDSAVQWWNQVFGLRETARSRFDAINADVAYVEGHDLRLELLQPANGYRVPDMFLQPPEHVRPIGNKALVFRVDDLARATDRFRDLGVSIVWDQVDLGDGSVSTAIRDNDGNFINVFQSGASPVG